MVASTSSSKRAALYVRVSTADRGQRWSGSLGHRFGFYKWIVPRFPVSD